MKILKPGTHVRIKKPADVRVAAKSPGWVHAMDPLDGVVSTIARLCKTAFENGREWYELNGFTFAFDRSWLKVIEDQSVVITGCRCAGCMALHATGAPGVEYVVRVSTHHHDGCPCAACCDKPPRTAREHIAHDAAKSLVVGCVCPACTDRRASSMNAIYAAHHAECKGSCCTSRIDESLPVVVFLCNCSACRVLRHNPQHRVAYAAHHKGCDCCVDCRAIPGDPRPNVTSALAIEVGLREKVVERPVVPFIYVPKHPVYKWRGGDCWDPEGWWY